MEKTLVLIKPDGVEKGLIGEIINRFERRGLIILALKMIHLSCEQAEVHYGEHLGKPFFPRLVNFITSGPVIAMVLSGNHAIKVVRTMMGVTNPVEAAPGTIRGDFALDIESNIIHGSDNEASAFREIRHFFMENEIIAR